MLCSSCSVIVRPVVAIDIDGTIGAYHNHFEEFARNWLGPDHKAVGRAFRGGQLYREWFCETYSVDLTTFRTIKLAYRQGGLKRSMPIYPGARDMIEALLNDDEAEVWLTTTRPHDRYDRVDPDTREWMRRHDIEPDGLLFEQDKYGRLADIVGSERVAFVFDDLVSALARAREVFPGAALLLRHSRFNELDGWLQRTADYEVALECARERIHRWKVRNQQGETT